MLSPGYGELKERLIRLGHMGPAAASLTPVVAVAALGRGMADLGVDVRVGDGLEAALEALAADEASVTTGRVRLPPFEIHTPATLDEAGALMERLGDDAVLYAGGTELLLVMKLGFADYGHVVNVKGIAELRRLELDGDELVIGGGVTHRAIERSPLVRERWPALAAMTAGVANVRVRGAGTLGGNLAFADPHSDPATFLLAADARIEVWGPAGARTVPIDGFVLSAYQTALAPGEIITAVRVPPARGGDGGRPPEDRVPRAPRRHGDLHRPRRRRGRRRRPHRGRLRRAGARHGSAPPRTPSSRAPRPTSWSAWRATAATPPRTPTGRSTTSATSWGCWCDGRRPRRLRARGEATPPGEPVRGRPRGGGGIRGMRPGRASERGPGAPGAPGGGRRAPGRSPPGRPPPVAVPRRGALRLGPPDDAAARHRRADPLLAARQGAGRLQPASRDGPRARPPRRLRRLGRRGRTRLVVRGSSCPASYAPRPSPAARRSTTGRTARCPSGYPIACIRWPRPTCWPPRRPASRRRATTTARAWRDPRATA